MAEHDHRQLRRSASVVGAGSGAIGAALLAAPIRLGGPALGLLDPVEVRAVGMVDLALAPGLLVAGTRWPWVASRAALSAATAAWCLYRGRRTGARREGTRATAVLLVTSAVDARLVTRLRGVETAPRS